MYCSRVWGVRKVKAAGAAALRSAECRSLCLWAKTNQAEASRAGPSCGCSQAADKLRERRKKTKKIKLENHAAGFGAALVNTTVVGPGITIAAE